MTVCFERRRLITANNHECVSVFLNADIKFNSCELQDGAILSNKLPKHQELYVGL